MALLKEHRAALVLSETDEHSPTRTTTGPFIYIRLRRSDYSKEDMEQWAQWIVDQKKDAFGYLKHENAAPDLARQLAQALKIG